MALPVDSFLRPKRKSPVKEKRWRTLPKTQHANIATIFRASYFHGAVLLSSLAIIGVGLILFVQAQRYVAPPALFLMEASLELPLLDFELRERMGSQQSVVLVNPIHQGLYYTAVLGEGIGISSLAQRYALSIGTLLSFNGLQTLEESAHFEVVKLPFMDGLMVDLGRERTLRWVAKHYKVDEDLLRSANYINSERESVEGSIFIPHRQMSATKLKRMIGNTFIYPVFGSLKEVYGHNMDQLTGLDRYASGVLFQTKPESPVYFIGDGIIIESGYHHKLGYYIVAKHQEYIGFYGNLASPSTHRLDSSIKQGDLVGQVASDGRHGQFYFSLLRGGNAIDPLPLLH
ncbi:M23 family metallopeptidase [Entomospira culicis]|uniref:M23 family metallopeptidase n=1 Tax=Entomospira culicis TaxID=2719989 RepID=A0A968GFC9_9SPIO|nr:M23 family metallopeptidase [Entomospira culicis]NIZ18591.1 M23 family metallopeptidase [Entomospira culicis]NIZ68806.1 M23 family metallopeptidase [Entomospira culicis]WDI37401.1 M23 family metallopeptidase [Entomospira culicis]WDI39030.1 M23 family metallopeptidase [Entomospira culicis]